MTTSETMAEVTRRGQEAFASAMKIWADSWRPFVGMWQVPDAKVSSAADEFVDRAYDYAAHALVAQREFTKSMLAVTRSTAGKAAWVAQDAQDASKAAAQDAHDVTKAAANARKTTS
ncbi:MAG: hypothetical protein JO287_25450 [Pseudonocardiales bacterium]|nr:hypothetical protein [Pseudonocardiales bacterium]